MGVTQESIKEEKKKQNLARKKEKKELKEAKRKEKEERKEEKKKEAQHRQILKIQRRGRIPRWDRNDRTP